MFRSEESVGDAVKLIIQLPQNSHIALKMTSLELLAELTPWVDEHPTVVGMCCTLSLAYFYS